MTPYEIVGQPLTLWLAPVATAFPLINAAPAEAWVKVGTSGDENYSEEGVTVAHNPTFSQARPAGTLGPVKAWLTAEDMMISLVMWDVSLEQYAKALNSATVTTTAAGSGTAGFKKMGLSRAEEVAVHALLARGTSPYGDGFSAQYEVPRCYQSGTPSLVYRKGQPAGIALQYTALEDSAASSAAERFGRLVAQHQAPI